MTTFEDKHIGAVLGFELEFQQPLGLHSGIT